MANNFSDEHISNIANELIKAGVDNVHIDKLTHYMQNGFLNENYLVSYPINEIIQDLSITETLSETNAYSIKIKASQASTETSVFWKIKLFRYNAPMTLSNTLPIIENFGFHLFEEQSFTVKMDQDTIVHICDFEVRLPQGVDNVIDNQDIIDNLQTAILATFEYYNENDALNRLVLLSQLSIREVKLMRAIARYMIQTSLPFSYQYIVDCLCSYAGIVRRLYLFFASKFDITEHSVELSNQIKDKIFEELKHVKSLDEDRILKACVSIIEAMVRTNFYKNDYDINGVNGNSEYIAFKINSKLLSFLPQPLPLYEIFIYSIYFEGIHLRGGPVSRGGIRWSSRKEDFRTEVLGLLKAQVVKNAVIIPTGAKGGFVCKMLPADSSSEAYMEEGIRCYQDFIGALLDLTDNFVNGNIVNPTNVIRYDDNDPYLVVAADKGTSTFSDIANNISISRGFWLSDAFASGGSAGYDHKKIGITAKGAWEASKRHLLHLGTDCQTQEFTVVGIGDMAGDVFGNGMLLSPVIKLIAAFNHRHIFVDPNPDVVASFNERKRLFELPKSNWSDYNAKLISQGGGVFERSAKSIEISKQMQEVFDIDASALTPDELIRFILKSRADMLYNGGIGTYVKSSSENNEQVKDHVNDALRIDGRDLRVKVVVEGGNLGFTQLGRIEFAACGGSINTDAIDNSAGVDCSDHEVNIKILLSDVMRSGDLDIEARNQLLSDMTNDVEHLVLRDNYLQNKILRYALTRSTELFNLDVNFIDKLEKTGELDRKVEFLPDHKEVIKRQSTGIGLTSPELAVLLAYSKINVRRALLNSTIIDSEIFTPLLLSYFPNILAEKYAEHIKKHYLRREIIATSLANLIVNNMGITFVSRFEDEFKSDAGTIVHAFWVVYQLFGLQKIINQIDGSNILADTQIQMIIRLKKAMERTIRWVMRKIKTTTDISLDNLLDCRDDVTYLIGQLKAGSLLEAKDNPAIAEVEEQLKLQNVPQDVANLNARSGAIPQLLDIVLLAKHANHSLDAVAKNYFYAGWVLRIDWLRQGLIALPENNKWQASARSALLADGYDLYSTIIRHALNTTNNHDNDFINTWINQNPLKISHINSLMDELQFYKTNDLAMLSSAVREILVILQS